MGRLIWNIRLMSYHALKIYPEMGRCTFIKKMFCNISLNQIVKPGRCSFINNLFCNISLNQIAEPGRRWACLVKKEWSTRVNINLGISGLDFDVRGFQGDYQVVIKKKGVPTQSMNFSLGKLAAVINIPVSANTSRN